MIRLVQLQNGAIRRVAVVEEPHLRVLNEFSSVYALAQTAMASSVPLRAFVKQHATNETLDYDEIYLGKSAWRLLIPVDHPDEPARCLVSGTGLTHLGSAKNRNVMHDASASELTDSMKMFRWGVEGGRPAPGRIGTAPEWFYKGN